MILNRTWSMPASDGATFDCKPIAGFVEKYTQKAVRSVDLFARNSKLATITNDLNPKTSADHHMKATDFLDWLPENGIDRCDLVIFDPPYSMRQTKELYEGIGIEYTYKDTLSSAWKEEKDKIDKLLEVGGVFLHFGWHTNGLGKKRGYEIIEILLVAHGSAHHDTLCMAEQKIQGRF